MLSQGPVAKLYIEYVIQRGNTDPYAGRSNFFASREPEPDCSFQYKQLLRHDVSCSRSVEVHRKKIQDKEKIEEA